MKQRITPQILAGRIAVPPSKSDGQRALLAAALAKETSRITGVGKSKDERAMLQAIRQMGARVREDDGFLEIIGIDCFPEKLVLTAGESGLGIRLLTAVCATFAAHVEITGEGSLAARPMFFFEDVLPRLGVAVHSNEGKVPVSVVGPMHGAELSVDGSLSSQFISGLLMALPLAAESSVLQVEQLASKPYVAMTLETLKEFGIEIRNADLSRFEIPGNQQYKAANYHVDADWSSASYWLTAAALGHGLTMENLRMSSLQADKRMLNALMSAGCKVLHTPDGITVDGTSKIPFEFDATDCPDLFPALVTLAAAISGRSKIKGVYRLEHKESNRAKALQTEFGKLGVRIELDGDEMWIYGTATLTGGVVEAHNDHRIAMCLAIAATIAQDVVEIEGAEAVAKSYPGFWEDFSNLKVLK